MNYKDLIKEAMEDFVPWKAEIIRCAKQYIETNDALRKNPCGWKSCIGPKNDPVWKEYYSLNDAYRKAYANLLMACDVEYGEDEIANAAWEWKYWKVMARKCCYYQKSPGTPRLASFTMKQLQNAETTLMTVCGLSELYKPSSHYIEQMFPNLKLK